MKPNTLITLVTFCATAILTSCSKTKTVDAPSACATAAITIDTLTVQHQMKGYELYSWPACDNWYYSILTGTNGIKSYDAVTGKTIAAQFLIKVYGKENVKAVLRKFPAGESIFWAGPGWLQNSWGNNYGDLQLPPVDVVNELQQYSTQAGLNMSIGY